MIKEQRKKAERLLKLHHRDKILILPNIWDVLGARLLEKIGFEAVATASASIAYSQGYDDGEIISFDEHLCILERIAKSTKLPVTADIERGYADNFVDLTQNIERLIGTGIVGINIEDSLGDGGKLVPVDYQCDKIRAIRNVADKKGVPLVINARTDVYISEEFGDKKVEECIRRAAVFSDAGADCLYPIACSMDELKQLLDRIKIPINVFADQKALPLKELEDLGVARVSIGPALLKSSLTKMMDVAETLKNYGSYECFTDGILSTDEVLEIIGES